MISNGFQDIPLLTLGVTASTGEASGSTDDKQDYNEQDGFNVPWCKVLTNADNENIGETVKHKKK